MRRVVVTGLGIVSPIGNNADEVLASLKAGKSGIEASAEMAEHGFRSQIAGTLKIDITEHVDKRTLRFMGPGAAYAHIAMGQAIADAGLNEDQVVNPMTGLIAGSGGPSTSAILAAHEVVKSTGATKRIGPFAVPKAMSSTVSANLATAYKIKGMNFSITSACSTSLHCIGMAAQQVALGTQDIMFAGGGEELDWTLSCLFDAMGAMSSKYNDTPSVASRAYDKDRDGFVIAGGAGIVVLEEYERAMARGAKIYAEITGYAANSDGYDMVAPSGEGAERCMKLALEMAGNPRIDYLNPHGTSTPVGDQREMTAVRSVFGEAMPMISSTKSLTGHPLGAAGAQEAIYCLLMMQGGFAAKSAHIENLDSEFEGMPILQERHDGALTHVMSNSFGFGGTNGTLVMSKV